MDTLKTIRDLKEASGFSSTFIYRQIKLGNLAKPLKIGRSSRWKQSDVEKWLKILGNSQRGYIDLQHATEKARESRIKQ